MDFRNSGETIQYISSFKLRDIRHYQYYTQSFFKRRGDSNLSNYFCNLLQQLLRELYLRNILDDSRHTLALSHGSTQSLR